MSQAPYIEIDLHRVMRDREIKTIEQLKDMTGLSRKAISHALNKKQHRMHTDTIAKLCAALDCSVGDLLILRKG
ncbi:hypothetical protein ABE28_008835 [Peribacillus muralis]|uniref:HTH cro/C1-type domain-containing protein n=1 Tax=Peribacillus muralis TaxID=264697 RepID=A0A1B3XMM3_9BACI|nr:helix-turn-helix transcriptional regulator [Peribacillus muralis]AOH54456.1 hypothetical protein ABE28_008835 [Peribacillus muralis]